MNSFMGKSLMGCWLLLAAMVVAPLGFTVDPAILAQAGNQPFTAEQWKLFLAPFHNVLLHYPIGFVTLAVLIDFYYLWRPTKEIRQLTVMLMWLCLLSSIVVIILGIFRGSGEDYDPAILDKHRWTGIGVGVFILASLVTQHFSYKEGAKWVMKGAYRLMLFITIGLLVVAGHEGGNLTHGADYLVKHAPPIVKALLASEAQAAEARSQVPANEKERFFTEHVLPIFDAKCKDCHGAEKAKGGYRLNTRENMLAKGHSDEPGIVPGDPMNSRLVWLVCLPPDHEDIMPPAGKTPLTGEEMLTLIRWIQDGAHVPEDNGTVSDPSPDEQPEAATVPAEPSGGKEPKAIVNAGEVAPPVPAVAEAAQPMNQGQTVDFVKEVQPILVQHCVECHGANKKKGKLRLDSLAFIQEKEDALIPGKPGESTIFQRVSIDPAKDEDDELMPPTDDGGPLSATQIATLKRWIEQGGSWPEGLVLPSESK